MSACWRVSILTSAFIAISRVSFGQLIAYESFTGITTGSGLSGSGSNASGWTDAGWNGGSDARFQVVNPAPHLSFQLTGGPLVDGGDRAVQLTTNPEPVPGNGLVAYRSITPQNTTLYVSFLVMPIAVGTGSDSLRVMFLNGSNPIAMFSMLPEQGQQYLQGWVFINGGGSSGVAPQGRLLPGQTYLIVLRISASFGNTVKLEAWVNPVADYASNAVTMSTSTGPLNLITTSLGVGIYSADTGGPTTTAAIDELRVGYTWNDVVPQSPISAVPDLQITRAFKLSWQSNASKSYQPQTSYDLSNWFNLGPTISGTGNVISIFDAADMDAEKFYRIQIH